VACQANQQVAWQYLDNLQKHKDLHRFGKNAVGRPRFPTTMGYSPLVQSLPGYLLWIWISAMFSKIIKFKMNHLQSSSAAF